MQPRFYTCILTNWNRSLLNTGMANNLALRLIEHWIGHADSFTTKYNIRYLVWYEASAYVLNAIELEKKIKKLTRAQQEGLVRHVNSEWVFVNEQVAGNWPPAVAQVAEAKSRWRDANGDKLS